MAAKGTPATALLARRGAAYTVHEYAHDPRSAAFGEQAAAAIGVDPARVFKTIVVRVDGALAVGVVPVPATVDLKALAAALGGRRAAMADPADAERATGYVRGGISPFGQRTRLRIAVDASAGDHETVFVSGGRRGLQVEVAPADLVGLTGAVVAAIAAYR